MGRFNLFMSADAKKSKEDKALDRIRKRAGHWRLSLTGHGESYFDELVVDYRTLPPHGAAEDPWARAAAKADQAARAAADTLAVAIQSAQDAAADSTAAPADEGLKKIADAKSQLAADAKLKQDEAVQAAAFAQGAVHSKLAAAQVITELIQKKERGQAIWSDILLFESALLRMLWFEPLKARLVSLREEYGGAMGAVAASAMSANCLDLAEMKEDKDFLRVQSEAVNLMGELHWQYLSAPRSEWQKTELSLKLGGYTAIVVALILLGSLRPGPAEPTGAGPWPAVLQWLATLHFNGSTLSYVLLAGAVGAALSAFQRIQSGSGSGAALLNLRSAPWQSLSVGVAPVIGALSAFLLTMMFAGGVLSGNFFPQIALHADGCATNAPMAGVSAPVADTNAAAPTSALPVLRTAGVPTNASLPRLTNLTAAAGTHATPTNASSDPRTWRDCKTFGQHRWCVAAGAELALLIIWTFIAGFSERLVPDMLTRLAKKAEGKV